MTGLRPSQQSSWPGERYPSQHDVELAHEPLEPEFLDNFTRTLLSSTVARETQDLMHREFENRLGMGFTYPMSSLSEFPDLPSQDLMTSLQQSFRERFANHVFINNLPLLGQPPQTAAPYYQLAIACLSASASSGETDLSRDLFIASKGLWTVMLEVDNSEARTLGGVLTAILLSLYAVLSADVEVLDSIRMEQALFSTCSIITRRLRLHEQPLLDGITTPQPLNSTIQPSIIGCLSLVNVLAALYLDLPIYLTTNELGMSLGPSSVHFQRAYKSLFDDDNLTSPVLGSPQEAMLLLTSLLSDAISVHRSLQNLSGYLALSTTPQTRLTGMKHPISMPLTVLSPSSEYRRMFEQLSGALDKWERTFKPTVGSNDIALSFFCRLYLACPQLPALPKLAGFRPALHALGKHEESDNVEKIPVSDESTKYAWMVLDSIEVAIRGGQSVCPVWCPFIVFVSGLVVWAGMRQQDDKSANTGSLKQLLAFKIELERMSWPCCPEMSSTLDRLIRNGSGPQG